MQITIIIQIIIAPLQKFEIALLQKKKLATTSLGHDYFQKINTRFADS
jgi:hypothetical protein